MRNFRTRNPVLWIIFLSSLLLLPLFGENTHAETSKKSSSIPEQLPGIFSPLSWDMKIKELHKLFPSAEIQNVDYIGLDDKKMIVTILSGINWAYFGEVLIHVDHHKYKNINMISISTTENRPECFEKIPSPKWCRSSYNDELVKILGDVKAEISKIYGPPLEFKGVGAREAAGLPPDPRETTFKWERKGFNLFLDITVGEEDDWGVALKAVIRKHPD